MITDKQIAALDSGIRDMVVKLNEAGFRTTDSGDGTKGLPWTLPYPHVFSVVALDKMIEESHRLWDMIDQANWRVEVTYSPADGEAILALLYRGED